MSEIKGIFPIDAFCMSGTCRVFDEEGLPFYYDDNHLSVTGSEFQARQLFLPYLKKVAEKESSMAIK